MLGAELELFIFNNIIQSTHALAYILNISLFWNDCLCLIFYVYQSYSLKLGQIVKPLWSLLWPYWIEILSSCILSIDINTF
jgi:hypothetical protein